jgi:hypothetical protein
VATHPLSISVEVLPRMQRVLLDMCLLNMSISNCCTRKVESLPITSVVIGSIRVWMVHTSLG